MYIPGETTLKSDRHEFGMRDDRTGIISFQRSVLCPRSAPLLQAALGAGRGWSGTGKSCTRYIGSDWPRRIRWTPSIEGVTGDGGSVVRVPISCMNVPGTELPAILAAWFSREIRERIMSYLTGKDSRLFPWHGKMQSPGLCSFSRWARISM
jgi:hypothetical protein